jgi:hypothetical protein
VGKWGQVVQGKHFNGHFLPQMNSSNLPKNTSEEEDDCKKKNLNSKFSIQKIES